MNNQDNKIKENQLQKEIKINYSDSRDQNNPSDLQEDKNLPQEEASSYLERQNQKINSNHAFILQNKTKTSQNSLNLEEEKQKDNFDYFPSSLEQINDQNGEHKFDKEFSDQNGFKNSLEESNSKKELENQKNASQINSLEQQEFQENQTNQSIVQEISYVDQNYSNERSDESITQNITCQVLSFNKSKKIQIQEEKSENKGENYSQEKDSKIQFEVKNEEQQIYQNKKIQLSSQSSKYSSETFQETD